MLYVFSTTKVSNPILILLSFGLEQTPKIRAFANQPDHEPREGVGETLATRERGILSPPLMYDTI